MRNILSQSKKGQLCSTQNLAQPVSTALPQGPILLDHLFLSLREAEGGTTMSLLTGIGVSLDQIAPPPWRSSSQSRQHLPTRATAQRPRETCAGLPPWAEKPQRLGARRLCPGQAGDTLPPYQEPALAAGREASGMGELSSFEVTCSPRNSCCRKVLQDHKPASRLPQSSLCNSQRSFA